MARYEVGGVRKGDIMKGFPPIKESGLFPNKYGEPQKIFSGKMLRSDLCLESLLIACEGLIRGG